MDKFIIANGCALRVRDEGGEKPVVMLLHGYLESIEIWDSFAPLLKPDFRVVSIDIPGHGISQVVGEIHTMEFCADVACGVLEYLGIEKCLLVGHSMGGYVALAFLEKYPNMLSGVVLLNSTPNADSDAKRESRQREIDIVAAGKKDSIARALVSARFAPENRIRFANHIEDGVLQVSLTEDAGIIAILRGMATRPDRNDVLKGSKVPTLLILGRGDELISAEAAAVVIENSPQAKVAWLENSGHMAFVEEPVQTANAIREFVGIA